MTPLLPLLLIGYVFAPGATVSYEDGNFWEGGANVTVSRAIAPLNEYIGFQPEPPMRVALGATAAAELDGFESAMDTALATPCGCTTSSTPLIYPDVSGNTWGQQFRYTYGVQIEGVDGTNPPNAAFLWDTHGGAIDECDSVLAYLRILDGVHQAVLRDYGVQLEVQHVAIVGRFYDGITPAQLTASGADTRTRWTALGVPGVHAVVRLGGYTRGISQINGYSCGPTIYNAVVPWNILKPVEDGTTMLMLATMAHEMGHLIFHMPHTQCLLKPDGSGRVEECQDDTCHPEPSIEPPIEQVTYMGYCYQRFGYPFPPMRLGPIMSAFGRYRVLHAPAGCFQDDGSFVLGTLDGDGDEYPNNLDTCPKIANRFQFDWYLWGTQCSGCEVGPADSAAWPLLAALPLLWWRRQR